LYGVWGSGSGDVFAVGQKGTILHSNWRPPLQADPVFALLTDSSLWEHTSGGWQELSGAGTILAVSSVTDAGGQDVAFAITADHNLWEYSAAIPGGWRILSGGSFASVSAATNRAGDAVAFGVLADNSLWEYSSLFPAATGHWQQLSIAGSILAASAVSDLDEFVYAITSDRNLWQHGPGGWQLLSSGTFASVSAGQNAGGSPSAFGVLTDNSLWEYNPAFGGTHWQNLSPAGTILSVATGGPDEVFAVAADHTLWHHTLAGWFELSAGNFPSASGDQTQAGVGAAFGVLADSSLWEYNPAFPNPGHWQDRAAPGPVLACAAPLR
jgi:hypothetical protein